MRNLLFLFGMIILLSFAACDQDDEMINPCVTDNLSSGILIVNEGPFNSGTGTITVSDNNAGLLQAVYQRNNCDNELGNIVQSVLIHEGKIFIVVNNADKIVVVDEITFEELSVIENLSLPRYLTVGDNGMLYLSQWGENGLSGSLVEIDGRSFAISRELELRSGPEELLFHDGKIYVPHVGGFGRDSILSVVDVAGWNVQNEIFVGDNPQSVIQEGGNIWCLSSGYFDFVTYIATPGTLSKINNNVVTKSITLDNGVSNLVYQPNLNMLYWQNFAGIQSMSPLLDTPEDFVAGGFYDLAFDESTNQLYAADAGNFADPGQVFRIETSSGVILDSIPAGIVPTEIYFY